MPDDTLIRRYHGCLRKHRCHSPAEAEERAQTASEQTGHVITSYKCDYCRWWHIGHPITGVSRSWIDDHLPRCSLCGRIIPEQRVEHARRHNRPLLTCSHTCARRRRGILAHDRRKAKRRLRAPAQKGS